MSIVLRCRTCKRDGQRSEIDGKWCHLDEDILFKGPHMSYTGTTDHEFEPDVIDVNVAVSDTKSTLPDIIKHDWPFGR